MSRVDYNGVQEKTDISTDVIGDYGNRILEHSVPWEPAPNLAFCYLFHCTLLFLVFIVVLLSVSPLIYVKLCIVKGQMHEQIYR